MTITPIEDLELSPLGVFSRIPGDVRGVGYLASDGSFEARWSILVWEPSEIITSQDPDFQKKLPMRLQERRKEVSTDLPFIGGAIASLNYEFGYELLGLPFFKSSRPLLTFSWYDHALIYDHHQSRWYEVGKSSSDWKHWIEKDPSLHPEVVLLTAEWSQEQYERAFHKIHESIMQGEIYQGCLTMPFHAAKVERPRDLFYELMVRNPAPMGMYLEEPHRTILSLSPERFLRLEGSQLETRPIKGTRPKGYLPEDQLQQQLELLSDQKEAAELSMITDLLRNDMGKVSKPGSVKVVEHQGIQECPKVWHTYSHIVSEVQENLGVWDIVKALFPGGSISGCPKRRAVEILREVEGYERGIYTGCLGLFSDHGRMDLNIAIRTLEMDERGIRTGFGGGIVADSEVKKEYEECFLKAKSFSF